MGLELCLGEAKVLEDAGGERLPQRARVGGPGPEA